MSVEKETEGTILQKPIEVTIGKKIYYVERPKLSTLLLVSEDISELMGADGIDMRDSSILIPHILRMIRHDAVRQARIIATFILGGERIDGERYNPFRRSLKKLTRKVMNNVDCVQANEIISKCLTFGNIGFFLSTSTSLRGADISQPTKI